MVVMSVDGTAAHRDSTDLPDRVAAAVAAATDAGFDNSCRPEHGRLLSVLAAGIRSGVIGETGTGCGVGLAWLASGAGPDVRLVSVESDAMRHAVAQRVFAADDRVTLLCGDWTELAAHGPFDLLVPDGGGPGKGAEQPLDPAAWLKFGGTLVIDDFAPFTEWPARFLGEPDTARLHWLTHPALLATEITLAADLSTVVARYVSDVGA
jgi:predicted O-methyltransferase YrrM